MHRPTTRAEAEIRAVTLTVHTYDVELDLTRGAEVFGSTSVIRFECAEPGTDTFAEIRPAKLIRVVLNEQCLAGDLPGAVRRAVADQLDDLRRTVPRAER